MQSFYGLLGAQLFYVLVQFADFYYVPNLV